MLSDPLLDPLILAPPPPVALAALEDTLRQDWGLQGALQPLGGERDRNFRLDRPEGEPLLIKLAHPDEDSGITDFQIQVLLHLEAAATPLPLPHVIRTLDGATARAHLSASGRPCLLRVLTFLPGRPLTGGVTDARAFGAFAARLDVALSGFAHPADRRRLLWDIREAPGLRRLLPDVGDPSLRALATAALDRFEAEGAPVLAALPAQAIHNDLNPHNVLADESGALTGIIDFGDMVRAPVLQEVATACAYLVRPGAAPLAGVEAFLAGYRSERPIPQEQAALLPVLIATRMAVTVLIGHWRAGLQPENAPYILRNMPGARAGLETLARRG